MVNFIKSFTLSVNTTMYSSCKNNKIFGSVIVSNPIYMMNNLLGSKIPTKFFLHFEPSSFNIFLVMVGMCGIVYKNITSFINYATLPTRSFISNHKSASNFLRVSLDITLVVSVLEKLFTATTKTDFFDFSWLFPSFNSARHIGIITQRRLYNNG